MRLINITVTHYLSAVKTVFPGVANGKQTVQWTFAVSSLRQQDRDGAIAASMFFKHLADASGTALMRLGTASVLISSTSDTFTRKPSEVQCFSRVSPTLLLGNRRRSSVLPDIQRLCSYIPDSFADVELNEISNDLRCRAAISSFLFRRAKNLVCQRRIFSLIPAYMYIND